MPSSYGLIISLLLVAAAFAVRTAFLPAVLLATVAITPSRESFSIATIDIQWARLVALAMLLRMAVTFRMPKRGLIAADYFYLSYCLVSMIALTARQGGAGFVYSAGEICNSAAAFIIGRRWLDVGRNSEAMRALLRTGAVASLAVAPVAVLISLSGENPLAGIVEIPPPAARANGFRATVMLDHAILFGCFWAIVNILFIGDIFAKPNSLSVVGFCGSGLCVFAAGSSTPIGAWVAGALCLCGFRLRRHMRLICAAIVTCCAVLALFMNRPLWFVIASFDVAGGSTAYHRAWLIDAGIRNFGEWAVLGVDSTAHWDSWGLLWDVTNHFLLDGVRGGALRLGLGVSLFMIALGGYLKSSMRDRDRQSCLLSWAWLSAGVAFLAASVGVAFFGSSTFWFFLYVGAGVRAARGLGNGSGEVATSIRRQELHGDGGSSNESVAS